jgi:hypothetical protein
MTPMDTSKIRLVELGDAPYGEYRRDLVRDYAADKVRAGAWSQAEAVGRAARDVDRLLPEGPATPGHFLCAVKDDSTNAKVGTV